MAEERGWEGVFDHKSLQTAYDCSATPGRGSWALSLLFFLLFFPFVKRIIFHVHCDGTQLTFSDRLRVKQGFTMEQPPGSCSAQSSSCLARSPPLSFLVAAAESKLLHFNSKSSSRITFSKETCGASAAVGESDLRAIVGSSAGVAHGAVCFGLMPLGSLLRSALQTSCYNRLIDFKASKNHGDCLVGFLLGQSNLSLSKVLILVAIETRGIYRHHTVSLPKSILVNNTMPGNIFRYRNVLVLTVTWLVCSLARHPPWVLSTAEI